jgi:hypothetical protein
MGRKYAVVIAFGLVLPLCGCGAADSGATFLPESFRQPAPRAEIEQPPDVHLIVRNNLSAIFTEAASPSNISVSFPVPAKYGGWTTCVRATAQGITGRSLGTQTYLVNIEHDQISEREHVDGTHWCAKETYQSL